MLALFSQMGDGAGMVYSLALLAWAAAAVGDSERAGRLWGAIEAEERRGPVGGGWTDERELFVARLERVAGDAFDHARDEGRRVPLDEAVEFELPTRRA